MAAGERLGKTGVTGVVLSIQTVPGISLLLADCGTRLPPVRAQSW